MMAMIGLPMVLCAQQNNNMLPHDQEDHKLISDMLFNPSEVSVKDAYYSVESSYGNCYLSYDEYDSIITHSAAFIKTWMMENDMDTMDNLSLNYGIVCFMRDTLSCRLPVADCRMIADDTLPSERKTTVNHQQSTHCPFSYDYNDFQAQNDFRNSFVTKAFATGSGQCNALPLVYLILAEALGAKAWLSYAPRHSFIKFPDNEGLIHNYDPTSHMHITDALYMDYLFISAAAIESRIYLDTLNSRQVVATCLINLGHIHLLKTNYNDLQTAEAMINMAMPYFHNGDGNIQAWFIRSSIALSRFYSEMDKYKISNLADALVIQELEKFYTTYRDIENRIQAMGHRELQKKQMDSLMSYYEEKRKRQLNKD
jgi:hypothetical protein